MTRERNRTRSAVELIKHAVIASDFNLVQALLEFGTDVNAADPKGLTTLYFAVQEDAIYSEDEIGGVVQYNDDELDTDNLEEDRRW